MTTTQEQLSRNDIDQPIVQYSFKKILTVWALSALPMAFFGLVLPNILAPYIDLPIVIIYWFSVIVGLVWQCVLSLMVLKHEGQTFDWSMVRHRLMYRKPSDIRTGRKSWWLLLWVLPFIMISALMQMDIGFPNLDQYMEPLIKNLPHYDMASLAAPQYKGAWWLLILYMVTFIFNYFLGEELMYRGILLPVMNGTFGRWDWLVNGILFGLYHLHKPQIILSTSVFFGFVFAFPSKYWQSNWMAIIIHGLEGILGLVMVLGVILGLAQ